MKKFIKKIWLWIISMYTKLIDKTQDLVPVAINIVEGIKKVVDSPVDDIVAEILKKAIPGVTDDVIIDKIHLLVQKYVPETLTRLMLVQEVAKMTNPNEQLKVIIAQLKLASDEQKNIIYHNLAALILKQLADGKLSWGESAVIAEYYYQNFVKK